jgi:hypothetical protein
MDMRYEGRICWLFLLLTWVVGWGLLVAQLPQCRHDCFDANNCGHCEDFVVGAQPPCLGIELCGILGHPDCRLVGMVHVKDYQQCLHVGIRRDQWIRVMLFDCTNDGRVDCACKGYHSCPKGYPHG